MSKLNSDIIAFYVGHTRMQRLTALEKDEIKKREKNRRDEEDYSRLTWAKFTLGLKHQV
jgi:hypothetical protein